jgi:hypothetical protein
VENWPQKQVQENQLSLSLTCNKIHILYMSTDGISVMSQAFLYWTVLYMTPWILICFCNNTTTSLWLLHQKYSIFQASQPLWMVEYAMWARAFRYVHCNQHKTEHYNSSGLNLLMPKVAMMPCFHPFQPKVWMTWIKLCFELCILSTMLTLPFGEEMV